MLLATFSDAQGMRVGILDRARRSVLDLSAAAPALPRDMNGLIKLGAAGLDQVGAIAGDGAHRLPLA